MPIASKDEVETASLSTVSIAPDSDDQSIETVDPVNGMDRAPTLEARDSLLTPIHRLPPEILSAVFAKVIHMDGLVTPASYADNLHILAQVCRTWANVVMRTPRLWTVVMRQQTPRQWRMALELSRSSPLTVQLLATSFDNPDDEQEPVLFLQDISPHVHRFEFVSVHVVLPPMTLPNLGLDGASLLRSLRYHIYETHEAHVFHPTAVQASRISRLDLGGLTMVISSLQSCTALLHLRLCRIKDVTSTAIILEILQTNPKIESLHLNDLVIVGAKPVEHPIVLSKLRSLQMERLEGGITEELAVAIWAPACAVFTFVQSKTPFPPSFINTVISRVSSTFISSLTFCDRILVHLTAETASVKLTMHCISLSRPGSLHTVALDGFSDFVDGLTFVINRLLAGLHHIPIWLHYDSMMRMSQSVLESLPLLPQLPSIQRLSLNRMGDPGGDPDVAASVFEQLIAPLQPGEEGTQIGLCPNMEELEILDCDYPSGDVLVRLVQSRSVGSKCAALRILELRGMGGMDHDAYNRIRQILGEGVFWDRAPKF